MEKWRKASVAFRDFLPLYSFRNGCSCVEEFFRIPLIVGQTDGETSSDHEILEKSTYSVVPTVLVGAWFVGWPTEQTTYGVLVLVSNSATPSSRGFKRKLTPANQPQRHSGSHLHESSLCMAIGGIR
jgi:hypothetical protein